MITTFASDISVQCLCEARRANRNQILITCLAAGGGAFNLTGYTFTFKVWKYGSEATPVISLAQGTGLTNNGVAGTLLIDITETQSTQSPDIYLMKLEATHPDTFIRTWINGTWKLNGDLYDGAATTSVTINLNATGTPVTITLNLPGGSTVAIGAACSDETTVLVAGTAKVTFRMPFALTLLAVRATLTTAQTSGSIFTVDINKSGTSLLSTKLTIDNTERTSVTAATAAVISDSSLADDAEITVDIDQIGDGTAKGLKVWLIGTR